MQNFIRRTAKPGHVSDERRDIGEPFRMDAVTGTLTGLPKMNEAGVNENFEMLRYGRLCEVKALS
jgi:hypothetical protein